MIRIACATGDDVHFYQGHFGDAPYYLIYEMEEDGRYSVAERIENTAPEERMHGDPEKAKGIMEIMKKEFVDVLINIQFGPNIKRIRKNFVPVLSNIKEIEPALNHLANRMGEIKEELKNQEKKIIILP